MDAEPIINAIGSLWKLAGVIVIGAGLAIFRTQLRQILDGLVDVTLKHGNTELALKGRGNKLDPPAIDPPTVPTGGRHREASSPSLPKCC